MDKNHLNIGHFQMVLLVHVCAYAYKQMKIALFI
jgi:hypothetical protein